MTTAIAEYLYLLDGAFDGREWHSLLSNLGTITTEDWEWVPPGGERTIRQIVHHVASCKLMYENHAFGDRKLRWDDPEVDGGEDLPTLDLALERLRASHQRLRDSVAALTDDAELLRPRLTNWGEEKETRWIIATMIQHDLYHAGEINHLRSLRQQSDRWAYG